MLYGQTPPGGLINLQSKRPTADARNEVGVQFGSFDRKQINADVGGKLDEEGNLLYRVVALSRDTGTQVDDVDAARILLAPSMTINFNEDTSLTLLASMQKDRSDPQLQFLPSSGTIEHNPNGKIDTDTAVGDPSYETFERDQYTLGYELNHRLNDNWDFQQNLRYGHMELELRQLFYYGNLTDSQVRIDYQTKVLLRTFELRTLGLPICHALPHAFDLFQEGRLYDTVVAVCDAAVADRCPVYPGVTRRLSWPFPDPAAAEGSEEERLEQVRRIRDQIRTAVEDLVAAGPEGLRED